MKIEFQGRALIPGNTRGKVIVTKMGLNPLASWKTSLLKKRGPALCDDQDNIDIYKKRMDGNIICLPQFIGSTSGGLVLLTAAYYNLEPKALLYSGNIDSLSASGVVLSDVWFSKRIITVDHLGKEFLDEAKDGDIVEIKETGLVILHRE